jgi:hypothetical protein
MTDVDTKQAAPESSDQEAWDDRALCPDDNCIGVIGESGCCSVCGRRGEGSPELAQRRADSPRRDSDTPPDAALSDAERSSEAEGEDGFSDRELCPDESCIGVLSPDGVCKVCGATKPATR